mmetsp:Transcript_21656/g.27929  ORF Transcript_21656/g.27929 Transcript_21656/m.27929 type:complete len:144 (-) Transcript_21656:60-491(-)
MLLLSFFCRCSLPHDHRFFTTFLGLQHQQFCLSCATASPPTNDQLLSTHSSMRSNNQLILQCAPSTTDDNTKIKRMQHKVLTETSTYFDTASVCTMNSSAELFSAESSIVRDTMLGLNPVVNQGFYLLATPVNSESLSANVFE